MQDAGWNDETHMMDRHELSKLGNLADGATDLG
jgi:hypothetical protein